MKPSTFPMVQGQLESIRRDLGHSAPMSYIEGQAIKELYRILENWSFEEIQERGTQFSTSQRALLREHPDLAPNSHTRFKMATLLFWHEREAFEACVQDFIYRLPEDPGCSISLWWFQQHQDSRFELEGWILAWANHDRQLDPFAFCLDNLKQGRMSLNDFFGQAPDEHFRLVGELIDALFDRRIRRVIEGMNLEWIQRCGRRFLAAGNTARLARFFALTDASSWDIGFLEQVYQHLGILDPTENKAFQPFEMGSLWAIRKRLFSQRLFDVELQEMRKLFWSNWLHRCSDARVVDDILQLRFGQTTVREELDGSHISFSDPRADNWVLSFSVDWEAKMSHFLTELLV